MFERYTEHARRTIFFARYEASSFGSPYIETEHLLLGLFREDKAIASRIPVQQIRRQLEERDTPREKISTSVDLPLSEESKAALRYGAEEADALDHKHIDCGHLLLGLLRIEKCVAALLLRPHGMNYETVRAIVSTSPLPSLELPSKPPMDSLERVEAEMAREEVDERIVLAPSLTVPVCNFFSLILRASQHLRALSDNDAERPLPHHEWSRKEALGHLVDYATTHHRWFARALSEPKLVDSGYPQDDWVQLQEYRSFTWRDLVGAWLSVNWLLSRILTRVPEDKLNRPCRIGIDEPVPLLKLISRYVEHCEDVLGQILARG